MHLILVLLTSLVFQSGQLNTDKKGVAIEGYDAVSYFEGKPVLGKNDFVLRHENATYLFSSKENLELFRIDPKKYIPQYGGWCAYAMGIGPQKVKINPNTFKIVDDKLYLFYDFNGNNTLLPWNQDESVLLKKADDNWQKIIE